MLPPVWQKSALHCIAQLSPQQLHEPFWWSSSGPTFMSGEVNFSAKLPLTRFLKLVSHQRSIPFFTPAKLPLEEGMTALGDNLLPSTYPIVFSPLRFPKPEGLFSGPRVLKLMLNQKDCLLRGLIGFGQRMSLSEVNPHVDHFFHHLIMIVRT